MADPFEAIYQAELADNVSRKLGELAAKNSRVANVSNLHMLQKKTQKVTGKQLGLSRDQVARLKTKAIEFLARELAEFKDYY